MLRAAIDDCRQEIEKGTSLADAMRRHRNIFSDFFITLIAAGEASGSLEVSLDRMGTQLEKEAKLKDSIQKAATYPIIVCVVAVIVVAIMLTYVVPQFETMLTDLGSELPAITVFVMKASDFMVQRWYIILAFIFAFVAFIMRFKKTNAGKHFFGKIEMHPYRDRASSFYYTRL
jgi:type IV pilus assembly protein PilC